MRNYLKIICDNLGVETIEEAVEIINKDRPDNPLTVSEIVELEEKINELYQQVLKNQNAFEPTLKTESKERDEFFN